MYTHMFLRVFTNDVRYIETMTNVQKLMLVPKSMSVSVMVHVVCCMNIKMNIDIDRDIGQVHGSGP
jgi:hypothetical protein